MTRRELEQCISLRQEIESIEQAMRSPKSTSVVVFYKDYRTGKGIPKAKRETDNGEEDLRIMKANMKACKKQLARRLRQTEKFIEELEDPEMRTIFRKRYIEGVTQKEIAKELHYTPARISQKINSFWLGQETTLRKKQRSKPI